MLNALALPGANCIRSQLVIATCRFRGLSWKSAMIGLFLSTAFLANSSPQKQYQLEIFCKLAAGERLSPWVAVACIVMGVTMLLF